MFIDKSMRRLFRFRLRTFLLVVTILALWLGMRTRQARQQQNAVNVILANQGTVIYDSDTGVPIRVAANKVLIRGCPGEPS